MLKQKQSTYGLLFVSLLLYALLGYCIQRYETILLFTAYFSLFGIYLYISLKSKEENTEFWLYASILFRSVMLFSVPALSEDFYRFIWDGRLLASGHHPFAEIPFYYIQNGITLNGLDPELFQKLNSPNYFTIYPPVAQFVFWFSVKISPHSIYGSILVMKSIIFLSEIGSLVLIRKLLIRFAIPDRRVLIYALNPLVILELTGNIHLEGIMISFLLLSALLLCDTKIWTAAILFALAICIKLIPLIFLPALVPRLGWKKSMTFYGVVGASCLILFLPLFDFEIISGFQNSIGYYFKKFEFNASIYYLTRELGYVFFGYNIIQTVGWKLALISTLLILMISFLTLDADAKIRWLPFKLRTINQQPTTNYNPITFLFILLIYLLFTTTVHPWYITPLLMISIFTDLRFVVLWTALIFLTYLGYSVTGFQENLWIILFEYLSVLSYLVYELWKREKLAF